MKATGIIRRVDELGRVVLPSEIRQVMGIEPRDSLEIYTEEGRIILQKYQCVCTFCLNNEDLIPFGEKRICHACLDKLKAL